MRRFDFTRAVRYYEEALALDPENRSCREKCGAAGLYQRVTGRFRSAAPDARTPGGAADYSIAVVNLDNSRDRLKRVIGAFRGCAAPIHRVPGIPGGYLPATAIALLTGHGSSPKGTLGCFLAHVSAWEVMLKRDFRHCLIIEDDVAPLLHLPASFASFGIPSDYDLCFVNRFMQVRLSPEQRDLVADFQIHPPIEAVRSFPPGHNVPGAQGYFLSQTGAQKLLDLVQRDRFGGDVDWRLLGYGVTPDEVSGLTEGSVAFGVLTMVHRHTTVGQKLTAFVLYPSLIDTVAIDSPRLEHNRGDHDPSSAARELRGG